MAYLYYIAFHLVLGLAGVYMINRMRSPKMLSTEMTVLIALTGSVGFFISLIAFLVYKAVEGK